VSQDIYVTGPPWKLAVIGMVAIIAGVALLLVDWTLASLAAFAAVERSVCWAARRSGEPPSAPP
jgi:hypothetical protein